MSAPDTGRNDATVSVGHAPDRGRYVIAVDDEEVGFVAYVGRGNQRIFFHTEIDDRFGGRNLASRLVAHAVADTRAAGLRIVPVCPYVARWLGKHPEFDDVRDPVTPAALAAVDERQG